MTYNYNEWLKNGRLRIFCKCGCQKEIIITQQHKYDNKIPEYIRGHYWKGKIRPEEYNIKTSKSCTGQKRSQETKEKMSLAKKGIPRSPITIQKMRDNHIDVSGKNNPNYGKIAAKGAGRGKRCYYNSHLQGEIYFRSSYELAYAKYLDEHKILWMYEIETFDLGDSTYTPDFFLPQFEKFIEIKGWMNNKSQEKINKFLEQYPWDLEILYKDDLIKLGCKFID